MAEYHGTAALARAVAFDERCATIFVDATGTIQTWNRAAELIFGYNADEAIGQRADLIVPAELREHHWRGFHRAVASSWPGSAAWGPIEPRHRSGRPIMLEVFLIGICESPAAPLAGIVSLFRTPAPAVWEDESQ
jgi:PAS domain S-box-containing protein